MFFDQLKRRDFITLLGGPTLLTGLSEAERELHRRAWAEKHRASEVARLDRLRRAKAAFDRNAPLLLPYIDSLTNADEINVAQASEQAAREAIAAAMS